MLRIAVSNDEHAVAHCCADGRVSAGKAEVKFFSQPFAKEHKTAHVGGLRCRRADARTHEFSKQPVATTERLGELQHTGLKLA